MADEVVQLSVADKVATLLINREKSLNALNAEVLEGLLARIAELRDLSFEDCRVVMIRGAGEKAFVAGADIRLMQTADRGQLTQFIELGQNVMRGLETLQFPVIAVVQGFAIGGGMELALACDQIVASTKAKFGQAEVNLGLIPGFGGTQRLALRAGIGASKRLVMSGETVPASEAYRLGIVDHLVEPDELEACVSKLAATLSGKAPIAVAAAKRCIEFEFEAQKIAGLKREVEEFLALFGSSDTKEGLAAFTEKRAAEFKGV